MAIPVVESSSTNVASAATSIVITKPSGVASGDLLVAQVATDGSTTITAPAGWSTVYNSNNSVYNTSGVFYKTATGSEPANYTWTVSGARDLGGGILRISGADAAGSQPDIWGKNDYTGATSTPVSPDVTTTQADCLILRTTESDGATAPQTHPGSHTEEWDIEDASSGFGAGMAWVGQAGAGASGTATWTHAKSEQTRASTIAIAPGAGGGSSTRSVTAGLAQVATSRTGASNVTAGLAQVAISQTDDVNVSASIIQVMTKIDPLAAKWVGSQFRAWIATPFRPNTDNQWWDWSALNHGEAYEPLTDIPDTTLDGGLGAGVTTSTDFDDASAYPDEGGAWVFGNADGESLEYVEWESKASNTVSTLTRETISNEQTGVHTDGARVAFWYPVTTGFSFSADEDMDPSISVRGWEGELRGLKVPEAVLRLGHLILIQTRGIVYPGRTWGPWKNYRVGWISSIPVQDNSHKERSFRISFTGIDGILGYLDSAPLKVGDENALLASRVTVSSQLRAYYKEDQDEFSDTSNPNTSGSSSADGSMDSLWFSEFYLGENNPHQLDDWTLQGFRERYGFTGFHITKHVGQGEGYRWIEVTSVHDRADLENTYIIAGLNVGVHLAGSIPLAAGARIIFAENPDLFAEENDIKPNTTILDLASYSLMNLNNAIFTIDTQGATGGTFTIDVATDEPAEETDPIDWDATSADIETLIMNIPEFDAGEVRVKGDAGGPWTVTYVNGEGSQPGTLTLNDDSTTGGSGVLVTTVQGGGTTFFGTGLQGNRVFDYLDPDGGLLRLWWAGLGQGQSQVSWGSPNHDERAFGIWVPIWTGAAIDAMDTGETARMIFDGGGSPTISADYWEVGTVSTPGYSMLTGDKEWALYQLPTLNLSLTSDITDISPANGEDLDISGLGGPSVDGLEDGGTLQVGLEQITYTAKKSDNSGVSNITRAANSTTADSHSGGDLIYQVVGGVATLALKITELKIRRPSGLMTLEDFTVRRGSLNSARNPEENNYTVDYDNSTAVTGHAAAEYTLDISGAPERIRWLLVEITKMSTQPARVRINEVEGLVATAVYDSSTRLESATSAEAISQLLENVGIPTSAITDVGDTATVGNYTTEPGLLWPIIADMADSHGVRVSVQPDSKIRIEKDPYWTLAGFDPTEIISDLDRITVSEVQLFYRSNRTLGQIKVYWRTPTDGSVSSTVFPATKDVYGQQVEIGSEAAPLIFADSTAADAFAKKRFWLARREYTIMVDVAGYGEAVHAGEIRGFIYDVEANDERLDRDRDYMVLHVGHLAQDGTWDTSLELLQLTREDEL